MESIAAFKLAAGETKLETRNETYHMYHTNKLCKYEDCVFLGFCLKEEPDVGKKLRYFFFYKK